jgi:hypothetical protein
VARRRNPLHRPFAQFRDGVGLKDRRSLANVRKLRRRRTPPRAGRRTEPRSSRVARDLAFSESRLSSL